MINYHILTYITPQAFIEDDDPLPILPPPIPTFAFEDDSWRQLISKVTQIGRRQSYGSTLKSFVASIPPVLSTLSVDEETWQHCLSSDLKWRTSLWF